MRAPDESAPWTRLLSPGHWPSWIALGVLRLLSLLPYRWIIAMGRGLGRLARRVLVNQAQVARCNMRLCLPFLSDLEQEGLLMRHFEALGVALFESAMAWWSTDAQILALAQIEGLEHLRYALARGSGVIVLTAHFTTLEIGARILNAATPINVVYRPPKNAVLAYIAHANRQRRARRAIRHNDVRSMVRALKNNECVWYAPDQSYRNKGAKMVPFFGTPAATNVSTARLVKLTDAAVLLYSHERLPDGRGYRAVIHPPQEACTSHCPDSQITCFNAFIESEVRRIPEQYWWVHRRFKGLTPDYPNYYGKAARR